MRDEDVRMAKARNALVLARSQLEEAQQRLHAAEAAHPARPTIDRLQAKLREVHRTERDKEKRAVIVNALLNEMEAPSEAMATACSAEFDAEMAGYKLVREAELELIAASRDGLSKCSRLMKRPEFADVDKMLAEADRLSVVMRGKLVDLLLKGAL